MATLVSPKHQHPLLDETWSRSPSVSPRDQIIVFLLLISWFSLDALLWWCFWHLSRHASSLPPVEINYDISAFFDDIQTTALLATALFYGIYHNQLQTRHQRLAILDTAVLHFGDGGENSNFKLLWGRNCFVLLGYGTSTTHIITLPFDLNLFGRKFICSY